MGKSCFFHIGDVLGSIQGYISVKELSDHDREVFECLDRGDWLGIEGETFLTRTGEPTVKVSKFTVLSKSLRPMLEQILRPQVVPRRREGAQLQDQRWVLVPLQIQRVRDLRAHGCSWARRALGSDAGHTIGDHMPDPP